MPTRRNPNYRGYSDPGIAQGFANLADIFKPPSGADVYGFTKARETQEKLKRAAELYAYVNDPNFDQSRFDRMGVATGTWQPNQSYYSVDSAGRVSRENNAADNARALTQTGMQQQGETVRSITAPLNAGQTRAPGLGAFFGMPDLPENTTGVINLNQGDTSYLPDGRVLRGAPKPLSEEQKKAEILGGMSPEEQRAIVFGSTPVEVGRRPDGTAAPMTRPQMLQNQALPVRDKSTQVFNYKTSDTAGRSGYAGTAIYDPITGGLVDSQTGQPIPAGSVTYSAQLTGDKTATGLGPTTANQTTANSQEANLVVLRNLVDQFSTLLKNNPGVIGIPGAVRGAAQDLGSVAAEFGAAFGGLAPDAAVTAEQVQQATRALAPTRDPAIQQARLMASDLAYKYAQAQNPSGEVSRQAFERALEALTGGALRNNQSALEALEGMRQFIDRQAGAVQSLRAPGAMAPGSSAPAMPVAPERWERGPDGQLRKVQ